MTDQEWWLQLAFYDADLSCLRNVRCENRSVAAGCEADNRQLGSDVNEWWRIPEMISVSRWHDDLSWRVMITKVWSLPSLVTAASLSSLILALGLVTSQQVQPRHWDRGESEKWEKGVSCHSQFLSDLLSSLSCQDAVSWLSISSSQGPGLPQPLAEVSQVREVRRQLEPGLEDERRLREEQSDHLQVRDHDQSGNIRQEKTWCIRMSVWKVSASCQSITDNLITGLIKSL